ncbi:MAG: metallophosphoesterase [bacterium]
MDYDDRVGVFGGVYNNHLALKETLGTFEDLGVDDVYCLGDLGAFGPYPDRVFPPLLDHDVKVVQGNYDHAIGNDLDDCQCGYTDPKDNYYAELSYEYTYENTSDKWKDWMKELPPERRITLGDLDVLMCHGSPRQTNEFLWESTTPDHFLEQLFDEYEADVILATHTGIHWHRPLPENKHFINVGVIGRPPNDGNTHVWATLLEAQEDHLSVEFLPIEYDYEKLARQMETENIPEEFIETIRTGWWTTCLEILPAKERALGQY